MGDSIRPDTLSIGILMTEITETPLTADCQLPSNSMQPALIIFDWDGTLMDSAARIVNCMTAAFVEQALSPPPPEQMRAQIGLGLEEAMLALCPQERPEVITRLMDGYRNRFLGDDPTPTPLFDRADEVVRALHQQGRLIAVATGKSRRGLDRALAQSGLAPYFHATRCADETLSKPNPQMLFELLDELGIRADAALMIGDTEFDLLMAKNAGMPSLAVSYGVHDADRLLACEPLGLIHAIAELPAWLATRG
ncbi:HAD family hydrolase [Thiorhodovibrio frisius]|uniref:Haloacid dehalogenase superfamily enzyme, subfamily IA n=1 Tax=Thiorhodovibrio frisius TaxID=631362 RepID=H8YXE0_9GAMM|nr:HAD-IA family hydrolase [Thiorhodovibrio frisius]EIC23116.1 haloacid dehalogenase superfamily enzyme, subfamily IA [Thiorhodovibrio frisius]WPL22620.1 Pyrophosphatase PpaX [Thiorhodovibrio frisius]